MTTLYRRKRLSRPRTKMQKLASAVLLLLAAVGLSACSPEIRYLTVKPEVPSLLMESPKNLWLLNETSSKPVPQTP